MHRELAVLALCTMAFAAHGQSTSLDKAVARELPAGWSIVERKDGEIPWGHHWCEEYKGVTGTKFVIRGPLGAKSRFQDSSGAWTDVVVGAEALEVWIMPNTYGEGWRNTFCFHRPIQPEHVADGGSLRIYARPAAHQNAEEERRFKEHLAKATAMESPESPWNDPNRISWQSWRTDLRGVGINDPKKYERPEASVTK